MGIQEGGKLEDWNFGILVLKTKDMILSTVTPADSGTRWLTFVIGLEFRTKLGLQKSGLRLPRYPVKKQDC